MFSNNGCCNYSLADIAAATGGGSNRSSGEDGWGGSGAWQEICHFAW